MKLVAVPKGQNVYNPQRKLGVGGAREKTYQPQRGVTKRNHR